MEIEWLILSDAVQVIGNKLYLMGGGWDVLTVNTGFPVLRHCGVSIAIRVPWNETNQKHAFDIEITDDDGHEQLVKMGGQFEVGRPAGIRSGQDQRVQVAAEMGLKLNKPGQYVIIASIDGSESRRASFNVVAGAMLGSKKQAS